MTPAVVGDAVYVGSCSGIYYALDTESGEVLWTYDTSDDGPPGQFHGDPVVTEELIVTGSDNRGEGHLYALERETGAVRWKQGFPGGVGTQVYAHDDAVFASTASGEVVAADLATGEIRWRHRAVEEAIGGRIGVDPVLAGDRFFVGWRTGIVEAWDPATGDRLWRRPLEAPLGTSLAETPGGEIVVGTGDGRLLRFSPDGEILGSRTLGERLYGDLLVAGDRLLAMGWDPAAGHFLASVSPDLEDLLWTHQGAEKWSTLRPLVREEQVLVGRDGALTVVGLRDGSVHGLCPVEGTPRGLASRGDVLYVGTVEGRLQVFPIDRCRLPTGAPTEPQAEEASASPPRR